MTHIAHVTTKKCSKCESVKDMSEFNKDKSRADGNCYLCRDCQNLQVLDAGSNMEKGGHI